MITGDHAVTAAAIAQRLGIRGPRDHGRRVRRPATTRRSERIGGRVFARVTPEQKVRLVDIFERRATSSR